MTTRIACMSAALGAVLGFAGSAAAETPACDQPGVVRQVASRFDAYSHKFLGLDLSISDFGMVRETRFQPAHDTWLVERRYCSTTATMTDGRRREVWYLIENNWGFAGMGSSVEFCVSGLDPWFVYGAYCKSLR